MPESTISPNQRLRIWLQYYRFGLRQNELTSSRIKLHNPMPESTINPSQGLRIWLKYYRFGGIHNELTSSRTRAPPTTTLCRSRVYPPSEGLRIWLQYYYRFGWRQKKLISRRFELHNPMPESSINPSQGLRIWLKYYRFGGIHNAKRMDI